MSNKKNIDQLFKERFKNHEVAPAPQVWENIQAAMREEKKDRKVIPLWWKVGGVAALLAILFTIGSTVFNTNETNSLVKQTNEIEKAANDISPQIDTEKEFTTTNNAIEVAEKSTKDSQNEQEGNAATNLNATAVQQNSTQVVSEHVNEQRNSQKDDFKRNNSFSKRNESTTIAKNESNSVINNNSSNRINHSNSIPAPKINRIVLDKNASSSTVSKEVIAQTTQSEMTVIKNKSSEISKPSTAINSDNAIASEAEVAKTSTISEGKKQSIFDAIEEQKAVTNSEEAVAVKDVPSDRWEVAPNFAPVYYNTLTEGSSIDGSFADNSQSGDVNISYGVAVSYAVSNRLSIRSGINNVNLGYSTGGLELGEGDTNAALRNINYNGSGQVIIPQDEGTFASQNNEEGFGNITPKSTNGEAFINQNITYYEVPLELKYSLFNTKLGVNVIGGLSTLFLGDNEITVSAGDFSETLGEANNLSNVSFSTNVGLGFDYKFSEKFKFNVEPMFKYQLNPYTDSSVNFQPYYVGVYTGLSYKF